MVRAPKKLLIWFEHLAHTPMTAESGEFLLPLVRWARPNRGEGGRRSSMSFTGSWKLRRRWPPTAKAPEGPAEDSSSHTSRDEPAGK